MTRKHPRFPTRKQTRELETMLISLSKSGDLKGPATRLRDEAAEAIGFDFSVSTIRTVIKEFELELKGSDRPSRAGNQTDRPYVLAIIINDLIETLDIKSEMPDVAMIRLAALCERQPSPYDADRK